MPREGMTFHEFYMKLTGSKHPYPKELVVGTVVDIQPHGVYVIIDEYGLKAYIPIKELSTKLIRNPRDIVRLNQKVVVRIYYISYGGKVINASLKRVLPGERQRKLQTWKKIRKSMILFQKMSEELNIPLEVLIEKLGKKIIEYYDTPYDGLEDAVKWGPETLIKIGISEDLVNRIYDYLRNNIRVSEITLKRILLISSNAPDGITRIKKGLIKGIEIAPERISVEYLSAPKYLVRIKGYDWKDTISLFDKFKKVVEKNIVSKDKWLSTVSVEKEEGKKRKGR
ncbi:MAG: S1 RNA-binding domain-containing protein [Candidatus Njordarchaeum guaymaensis]